MSRVGVHATGPRRRARALGAALLALAAAAALAACGSSGKGLIPSAHAGPLLGDFETVQEAAESGGGNCSDTEAALAKTEEDFRSLPATVDAGLRANLRQGIANLRVRARELCAQPLAGQTHTTTTRTTTEPKTTTTTTTPTAPKTTTTPPATSTTPPSSGGGTPAPGESQGGSGGSQGNEEPPAGGEESASGGAGAPEGSK